MLGLYSPHGRSWCLVHTEWTHSKWILIGTSQCLLYCTVYWRKVMWSEPVKSSPVTPKAVDLYIISIVSSCLLTVRYLYYFVHPLYKHHLQQKGGAFRDRFWCCLFVQNCRYAHICGSETYTSDRHQGVIKILEPHLCRIVMSSILMFNQWSSLKLGDGPVGFYFFSCLCCNTATFVQSPSQFLNEIQCVDVLLDKTWPHVMQHNQPLC